MTAHLAKAIRNGVSLLEVSELLGRHPACEDDMLHAGGRTNSEMRTTYMSVDVFCHMLEDQGSESVSFL